MSMPIRIVLVPLLEAAALGACESAPVSALTGVPYRPIVTLNRYPVRIVAVDGGFNAQDAVRVDPGVRSVIVESTHRAVYRVPEQRVFAVRVEPCTRYYLAAQYRSPLLEDWAVVVDYQEPIAGCTFDSSKAEIAGKGGTTPEKK